MKIGNPNCSEWLITSTTRSLSGFLVGTTIDGQNPAPQRMMIISLSIGFYSSQVVGRIFSINSIFLLLVTSLEAFPQFFSARTKVDPSTKINRIELVVEPTHLKKIYRQTWKMKNISKPPPFGIYLSVKVVLSLEPKKSSLQGTFGPEEHRAL